jgi:hypothetical protein
MERKMTNEKPEELGPTRLSAKALFELYRGSLVAVVTVDLNGDHGIGSAFHVGDGAFVTARHVIADMDSIHVEVELSHLRDAAPNLWMQSFGNDAYRMPIVGKPHPNPTIDVAVFAIPELAALPAIPLGQHLDDWINDDAFILNEVLVLGFPPIPLAQRNVLVASRAQVSAVVDLINVKHVHFIVSAMARGGFSGGVALSEWGVALGVITASLLKNSAPEELGYLTVLTVEPILECLAEHGLLPRDVAELWDGLFTANIEHFGIAERNYAHSSIKTDRDGHRARISLSTPSLAVAEKAKSAVAALAGISYRYERVSDHRHCWEMKDYSGSGPFIEELKQILRESLINEGYEATPDARHFGLNLSPTDLP